MPKNKFIKSENNIKTKVQTENPYLFSALRALRNSLAVKEHVPAYVIFNDATLKDMCSRLPCTENEFSGITGVGQKKLDLYGRQFIELIQRYCDNANNKDGRPPADTTEPVTAIFIRVTRFFIQYSVTGLLYRQLKAAKY